MSTPAPPPSRSRRRTPAFITPAREPASSKAATSHTPEWAFSPIAGRRRAVLPSPSPPTDPQRMGGLDIEGRRPLTTPRRPSSFRSDSRPAYPSTQVVVVAGRAARIRFLPGVVGLFLS